MWVLMQNFISIFLFKYHLVTLQIDHPGDKVFFQFVWTRSIYFLVVSHKSSVEWKAVCLSEYSQQPLLRTPEGTTHHGASLYANVPPRSPHKNLYATVYISFIHNLQNQGTTKMCFNTWMEKHALDKHQSTAVQWIQLNNEKERMRHTTTWGIRKWILLSESRQTQKATYHMIPLYDILEKAKLQGWEYTSGCQALGQKEGLEYKEPIRGHWGDGTVVYESMVWPHLSNP